MSKKSYDDAARISRLESIVEKQQAEINRLISLTDMTVKSLGGLTEVVSRMPAGKK